MKKTILSTLVIFAIGSSLVFASTFSDVPSSHYYYDSIQYLVAKGVVVGNGDGSYDPDDILNRAEAMTMISRAVFAYEGTDSTDFDTYESDLCFSDVDTEEWYNKYVCHAFAKGWVIGYGDGTFGPGNNVAFAEALKMVYMSFGFNYEEDEYAWYQPVMDNADLCNYIPDTVYYYNQSITRAEISDVLARIIENPCLVN